MFKRKKLLTKEYMRKNYYYYDKEKVYSNKTNFITFLNTIEKEFYNHTFKIDDRYVCVGRHRFLINEMQQLYFTKEQCEKKHLNTCPTIWCLDSLIELIINPNFLDVIAIEQLKNTNEIYLNKNNRECMQIYERYNQEGVISLNERDYILHALNMIKDSLDKCNEKLEWTNN